MRPKAPGLLFFMTFFQKTTAFFSAHPFESLFLLPLFLFFGLYTVALFGFFYPPVILLLFILTLIGGLLLLSRRPLFCSWRNGFLGIFLLAFALFAFSTHPLEPVGEGRDQGTFINSTLLLVKNHNLSFQVKEALPFFDIYGPGKALHFPGFAYTKNGSLEPEFPLGYTSWLAGFVTIFGISGFTVANIVLYVLSGLLLATLLRRVLSVNLAFFSTLIFMASFLPLWFVTFSLTENLSLFLFLLTAECAIRFQVTKERVTLLVCLASALALAFTRIEGWFIFCVALLILAKGKITKEWLRTTFFQNSWISSLFLLFGIVLVIATFFINTPYYKAILKALLKSAEQNITTSPLVTETLPLYSVLWEYGLLATFCLGLIASLYLWKSGRWQLLIPFLLAIVTLPYLLLPHITFDAPWMLRRFLFTLYPALFLSLMYTAGILVSRLKEKRRAVIWILFFGLLLAQQIIPFQRFLQTRYEHTLLPQVETLSASFTENDLLLIDKDVTSDNFMIPSRALSVLYHRPAVYFFNPADLGKLNTQEFERVFLLIPEEKKDWYAEGMNRELQPVNTFTFINDHSFRSTPSSKTHLPKKQILSTKVLIIEL